MSGDSFLDKRRVSFEPHHSPQIDNWTGVWVRGESTLRDLERRVEALEKVVIVPRPPFWHTAKVRAWRTFWHRYDLPCPFCRIERGRWR